MKYKSQRIAQGYRLENRAQRLLDKLTVSEGTVERPKGMHRSTYRRILGIADEFFKRSRAAPPVLLLRI